MDTETKAPDAAESTAPVASRRRRATTPSATNGAAADGLLSTADILDAEDMLSEDVPCPEWKGTVRIRGLTSRERDDYEASIMQIMPDKTVRQRLSGARENLVAKCAIDAKGNRLFTDAQAAKLGTKSGRVMDRLFDVASRLSGLRAEDVNRLVKHSMVGPSGDSASTSGSNTSTAPRTS